MFNYSNSNLFLGTKREYKQNELFNSQNSKESNEWAFVHIGEELFKQTTQGLKGWKAKDRIYIQGNHLYLYWLDLPDQDSFNLDELQVVLDFIDQKAMKNKKIFIHCDYGQSRSPSIFMTYINKRFEKNNKNFEECAKEFNQIYLEYFYPTGISNFLENNWSEIR